MARKLFCLSLSLLCVQLGCSTTSESKPFRIDSYMSKVKEAEGSSSPQFADTSKASGNFSLKRSPKDYMVGATQHSKDVTKQADKMVNGEKPSFFSRFRKKKPNIVTKFNEKPIPQVVDSADPTSLAGTTSVPANVYLTAAALSEQQGAVDKAISQYRKLLATDPSNRQGLIRLARVLHSNGRMDESIDVYRTAVAAYPHDAVILNDMGLCLARSGQHREAINAIRQAQQANPKNLMYTNNLAAVLVESDQISEAIDVLKQHHGPAIAHYNVGYMLNQQGDKAGASEHFATSLRYDPHLLQAQQMLNQMTPMVSQRQTRSKRTPDRPLSVNPTEQRSTQSFYYPETQTDDAAQPVRSEPTYQGDSQVQNDSNVAPESYVASDLPLGLEGDLAPIVNASSLTDDEPERIVALQVDQPGLLDDQTVTIAKAIDELTDASDDVVQTSHIELANPSVSQPSQLRIIGHDKSEAIEPPLPMEFE